MAIWRRGRTWSSKAIGRERDLSRHADPLILRLKTKQRRLCRSAAVALAWFSPSHNPATMFMQNSITKRCKFGHSSVGFCAFCSRTHPHKFDAPARDLVIAQKPEIGGYLTSK